MMTIDIYEQGIFAYNTRKAIRNIISSPTVSGVNIKHFDFGNGADSSIILDATPNINPETIKYIVLKETDKPDQHYYVTGFQFISQRRFSLTLLRNAWYNINKHKNAYIKKSCLIPSSVLAHKPEQGLNFNKIKANEILVKDQYGNGPWGLLYLNKTESDLSVALNDINYNITGTEIPVSPDTPVQQPDDSYLAYYKDYTVVSSPTAPSAINGENAYLYEQINVNVSGVQQLPDMTDKITIPVKSSTTTTVNMNDPIFGSTVRLCGAYKSSTYPGYYFGCAGTVSPDSTITYDESGLITAATGTISMHTWVQDSSANYSSRETNPWNSAVRESISTNGASGTLRTAILSCKYIFPNHRAAAPSFATFVVGTYIQQLHRGVFSSNPTLPPGKQISDVPPNGVYRTVSGGSTVYHNYTFPTMAQSPHLVQDTGSLPVGSNAGVDIQNTIAIRSSRTTDTYNHVYPVLGFKLTTTYNYDTINTSMGSQQVYPSSTRRTYYANFSITSSEVSCTNQRDIVIYNGQPATTSFILSNLPGNAGFWAKSSVPSFPNPGINMPTTADSFQTNGLSQEFTHNNVKYIYSPFEDLSGYYRVGSDVFEVTQSVNTVNVTAPLNYTVTVPSYETSSWGYTSGTYPATASANVNMYVTHLGAPVAAPLTIDAVLPKEDINENTIVSEPYAILAIPLFNIKYSLDGTTIVQNNLLESQKIFYDMIRTYSGTGQIADAQIFPYAPEIFKTHYNNDANGVWVNMQNMNRIGKLSGGEDLNSIPLVALDNSNINFSFYFSANPYPDKRKEATLRSMRLASPNYDSIYEYNYYDFNNEITNWGAQHGNADSRIDVDITLKPFNTYVHAAPYIRDNTLMGSRDFDDLRGLICGSSIFESSMTSSAFETFKRQNTMYEQIQQRTVDSMEISLDVERQNEIVGGILGTAQVTAMGALAGGAMANFTVLGNNASGTGAIAGGITAGIASGAAYALQYAQNEKLRIRELSDQKFYYEANIANIKAQPDTLNRVSSLNQDILQRFGVVIEQYTCTSEEAAIYDRYIEAFGHSINIVNDLYEHLINGCYVEGQLITSDEPPHIHQRLDEDLRKGVYYYEQV